MFLGMKPLPTPTTIDEICDIETGTTGSTLHNQPPKPRFVPRPLKVWPPKPTIHTLMSQADRIIKKFGSAPNLARALLAVGLPRSRVSIHRWTYPKEKGGTGGLIPPQAWDAIIKAAHYEGVQLTADDFDPRILDFKERVIMRPEKEKK